MKTKSNFFNKLVTFFVVLSLSGQSVAFAQPPQQQDNVRIGYNNATGKVSFIGADPSKPITISSAQMRGLSTDSSARAMIALYAADFGLRNPGSELELISADQVQGREVTRFQQVYKGIPIMGGEMIVNATDQDALLSLSGDISPDLALDINPALSPKQAQLIALSSMSKIHQVSRDAFEATEPELWIYDSRLLEPDGTKATLVWRMEVKSRDNSQPINELVLVDARRGVIVLNFNQIDTAWATGNADAGITPSFPNQDDPPTDTPTATSSPEATETPVVENTEIPTITPAPEVTETPVAENAESQSLAQSNDVGAQAATTYYVDIVTGNDNNSCTSTAAPCQHIQETINKAANGDMIYVTTGVYTDSGSSAQVFSIVNKNINLTGGWNSGFSIQNGITIIDGENQKRGMYIQGSTVSLDKIWIKKGQGNGLYFLISNITMTNSTVSGSSGTGIYGEDSNFSLINSTVSENTAGGCFGGGMYITTKGEVLIQNSTITQNTTTDLRTSCKGGVVVYNSIGFSGTLTIQNSIISKNANVDCSTSSNNISKVSNGFNILGQNDSNNSYNCFPNGSTDLIGVDPLLSPLNPSSGLHFLTPGSLAIDAGNPLTPGGSSSACTETDQAGRSRPIDGDNNGNARCDLGAYETDILSPSVISVVEVFSGSPQFAKVSLNFSNPLIAIVKDQYGLPKQGVTVNFTAPGGGASGIFSGTETNIATAITDIDGKATASTFTANSVAGSYYVNATVSGVASPAKFQLENQVSSPTSVTVSSGSNQSTYINTAFTNTISALVKDQFGSVMPGITVTFTAPASGASSMFSNTSTNTTTAATNASGIATSSSFTANGINGTYVINATASEVVTPAAFQMTNLTNYYVNIATGNDGNSCTSVAAPCQHIQQAVDKAGSGVTIFVAAGLYQISSPIVLSKSLTISGGWNSAFVTQAGSSIIDGQNSTRGISIGGSDITVVLDHLIVEKCRTTTGAGIDILNSTVIIKNSIIRNNDAYVEQGGGIRNSGSLSIINSAIYNNNSGSVGGGIFNNGPVLNIEYSTIAFNTGGGVHRSNGNFVLSNSILASNVTKVGFLAQNCSGGINYSKYSIISDISGCNYTAGPGNHFNVPALITPPISSGPYAGLIGILPSSPAIDLGENAVCPAKDQKGMPRPVGTTCDIGAWESTGGTGTVPASLYAYQGNQVLLTNVDAPVNFAALVLDANGLAVPGVNITFTAPLTGAGGVFANNSNITNAVTNSSGIATASSYKSNYGAGAYTIQIANTEIASPAQFNVQNTVMIRTYNMVTNTENLPGIFVCDVFQPDCGANDAAKAQTHAVGTYLFYYNHHQRKSIDDATMEIISSVLFGINYKNSYWSGTQMVFGSLYPYADDVVAHEFTHGVTQYESNLFQYYQSGAINESFSDVWGELFDQSNGMGTDTPQVKWLIGEDSAYNATGALRSMSNPPLYSDPDKMTSTYYYTGSSSGVHNSGINNKAAYLMVDGGSFNGKTVSAIGADKTLAIYYEVQTNLLTSGANYADLYNALYQGCLNLVGGPSGIIPGDCEQVRNATDAVEMNLQPVAISHTESPLCSVGSQAPNNTFYDDLESGTSNWTIVNGGATRWQYGSSYGEYAHSGKKFLYADDYPAEVTDAYVKLRPITIPVNGYLNFAHAYDFEKYSDDPSYYDGGILEYSTNGGKTWLNAGPLIEVNGYVGTISTAYNNPLKGRPAFVGTSHGYISTRLNLSSLAGKSVIFRWRMGLDDTGFRWGWWLDDVQVYQCMRARPYVVSSASSNANPTNATNVNFTVTFSDPVTGLNTSAPFSDFILTTTGIAGASITAVTGSGAVRTVAVNTGIGNGTIRLDIIDDDTILDFSSGPLGGPGISNGDFSAGEIYAIDKTEPTILSIVRTDPNPNASTNVNFRVTFSESVTGVDISDFSLNITDLIGATISSVNGSGAVRIIKVNTGIADGTVSLDAIDNDTILDAALNPLASGFATGEEYTIDKPDISPPRLRSPRTETIMNNTFPTFWWTEVVNISTYEIIFVTDNACANIVDSQTVTGTSYTVLTPFGEGKYFWCVRVVTPSLQTGEWSLPRSFTIDTTGPTAPVLSLPADNTSTRYTPTFKWRNSSTAVLYEFQYDNDSNFSSPTYTGTSRNNSRRPPAMKIGTYYWRVRAKDAVGNWGAWSAPFTITITGP